MGRLEVIVVPAELGIEGVTGDRAEAGAAIGSWSLPGMDVWLRVRDVDGMDDGGSSGP